jgi:hypothetical protein
MESHTHRPTRLVARRLGRTAACLLCLAVLAPGVAAPLRADPEVFEPHGNRERQRTSFGATVTTNEQGVRVEVWGRQQIPERTVSQGDSLSAANVVASSAGSGGQASRTGSSATGRQWFDPARGYFWSAPDGHVYSLEGMNIGQGSSLADGSNNPGRIPVAFNVDGQFQDIVWLPTNSTATNVQWSAMPQAAAGGVAAVATSTNPRDVAVSILRQVPLPSLDIRMNPSLGLVAVPGWFWVEGYDGQPFGTTQTVRLPPEVGPGVPIDVVPASDPRRRPSSYTVQVRVSPSRYDWSFGDGMTVTTQSLGKAYPAESDIKHVYEYSSLRHPGGFPVRLAVEFAAQYRVNGGPAEVLPPVRRTYEASYRVQEAQSVLAAAR